MASFSKVSMGFAEFVSQLIHETFDAILDSQNYQLEKYLELEEALNTSNPDVFRKKYISDVEYNQYIESIIGFVLKDEQKLSDSDIKILKRLITENNLKGSFFDDEKLSKEGKVILDQHFTEKLVAQKRSKLDFLINQSSYKQLVIDGGQINTKMDLFFLNQEDNEEDSNSSESKQNPHQQSQRLERKPIEGLNVEDLSLSKESMAIRGMGMEIKPIKHIDKKTGVKTVLINKKQLKNAETSKEIDTVRIVANPVSNSLSGNYFSEISISFKQV